MSRLLGMVAVLTAVGCERDPPSVNTVQSIEGTSGREVSSERRASPEALAIAREVRELHARCEEQYDELDEDIDEADRRVQAQAWAAVLVTLLGEGMDDTPDFSSEGLGGQPPCPSDPSRMSPCVDPTLSTDLGAASPAVRAQADADLNARDRVAMINRAIDAIDAFLADNPQPENWSDEQRVQWAERRSQLALACD